VIAEACFSTGANCKGRRKQAIGPGAARYCAYAPGNCGHGTHTAHTAAGEYGVARSAQILAVQVFSKFSGKLCAASKLPSPCALSYDSDQMKGLEFVLKRRRAGTTIASVNISIGGGKYARHCDRAEPAYAQLVVKLRREGVATFISSGNSGYSAAIGDPACISTAVSVGASTLEQGRDAVASFSNSARILNLLAPGDDIYSALPGNRAASWDGTSMAAPHAAGAFAVLRQLQPTSPARPLLLALASSGTQVKDPRNGLARPRINVWQALVRLYNAR
jgi:subtilisin family serine protease